MPGTDIKARLAAQRGVFGPMIVEFFVPGMAAMAAAAGADFILFDMEHSGAGIAEIKVQCAAARGLGISPWVRVPTAAYHFVSGALDAGAEGIMVPMVESAEVAAAIVSWANYPPQGRRGAAFGIAHDDYRGGDPIEKMRHAAQQTLVIAQVETATGIENIEAIAAVAGIDMVWIGHFDLTNFLGIPGRFDDPVYTAAIDRVLAATRASGKPAGFMVADERWARDYWRRGFRALAYGLDHLLFQKALAEGLAVLKDLAARSGAGA